jgi:PAS domain S-box-containing protein
MSKRITSSLTFKIGIVIILAELLVLTAVGYGLYRSIAREIENRLTQQILLPGALLNESITNLGFVDKENTLSMMMDAQVLDSMLISPNDQIILLSMNSQFIGQKFASLPATHSGWLDPTLREARIIAQPQQLISITPVYDSSQENLLYYYYLKIATDEVQAQKYTYLRLFVVGSLITIGLTSLILIFMFNLIIIDPITAVLQTLNLVKDGNLYVRVPGPISHDEIGRLQQGVNDMAEELQSSVERLTGRLSQLRQTEAALRHSEEKYRDFVEGTDDLIIQMDRNGTLVYVNHTTERIFGLSQEACIGLNAFDFIHPDDREFTEDAFLQWISGQHTSAFLENRQISKNGQIFYLLWTINVYFDDYGNVNYVNAIARDITSRREVEEQLQLQAAALQAAANGIVITDTNGRIQWVNAAFTQLTGYSAAEAIGQRTNLLNSGIHSKQFYQKMWHNIRNGQVWQGEISNRRKDGSIYLEEMTITPVYNHDGATTHFIAIKQDITERKLAEKKLHDRAASLELIALIGRQTSAILDLDDLLHIAVNLISETFNYYNVVLRLIEGDYLVLKATSHESLRPLENKRHLKVGQGITGWVAQTGHSILVPDVRQDHRYHTELETMQTISEAAVPIARPHEILGVLDVQSIKANDFDELDIFTLEAISAQLAVAIDNARLYNAAQQEILDRKHAEEKLQIYAAELERSNRELQNFAYVSSHDLQEPLRKIQTFSDRLQHRYSHVLDERGQDYLNRMESAAARMQSLIVDLLAFSRVITRTTPFEPVNLNKVIKGVLEDLETQLDQTKGVIELHPLLTIDADSTQMRQLFQNLISNALKYHKPDTPPHVIIQGHYPPAPPGYYCITVQDNGIGFDEKYLDRIFTVFQRLHGRSEYEGTGVGLAICRKITERHKGSITATSTPNIGATFIVTLPIHQENPPDPPDPLLLSD